MTEKRKTKGEVLAIAKDYARKLGKVRVLFQVASGDWVHTSKDVAENYAREGDQLHEYIVPAGCTTELNVADDVCVRYLSA